MFDPDLREVVPGVVGSAIAFLVSKRQLAVRLAMFVGGCVLAWVAPKFFVEYFSLSPSSIGLASFVVGVLGMSIVSKAMDLVDAINVSELWSDIRKKIGLGGGTPS